MGGCQYSVAGIERYLRDTVRYYRKNVFRGDAEAQYQLGRFYEDGDVVERDLGQALCLYIRAAEQGHEKAKEMLNTPSKYDDQGWRVPASF